MPEIVQQDQTIVIRRPDGTLCEVTPQRKDLMRRAMAMNVAKQTMFLVQHHHKTEAGKMVKPDHQWMAVYKDCSPDMRVIAPAQRGKTLYNLVKTFAQLMLGLSVGWVMPKENKITELVAGKLDLTVKNTPLYQQMIALSDGKDNARFKTFGAYGKLYLVTANSPNELTSFSADAMHIDERDFCNRTNLPMYPSRMNASDFKLTDEISTPTFEGKPPRAGQLGPDNIHSQFLRGDQCRYFSSCPHCGWEQILDWYDNVVTVERDDQGRIIRYNVRDPDWAPGSQKDCRVCCAHKECGRPFDRLLPGVWRALHPERSMRTRWMEALCSSMGPTIAQMLETFVQGLANPGIMQQFQNMDLGRTFSGGSMRFTEMLFARCVDQNHYMAESSDGPCTIGIDVNAPWIDVQISRWVQGKQIKVHAAKLQGGIEEIISTIRRFHVVAGVVDQQPEGHFVLQLQEKALSEARCQLVRCKYATNDQSSKIVISEQGETKIDPPRLVTVNRTMALDAVFATMLVREVTWFKNWNMVLGGMLAEDFFTPVRKLTTNEAGIERFVWEGKPDHQLHAAVYDQLAGELLGMNILRDLSQLGPMISDHPHLAPTQDEVLASNQNRDDRPMIIRG